MDIGVENKCSNCGKDFFALRNNGTTPIDQIRTSHTKDRKYSVRGYYSNIKYDNKVSHSVKNMEGEC